MPSAQISDPLERALAQKARDGGPGHARARPIAAGEGWRAFDIVCTSGPDDRPFEERHEEPSVSVVISGTFSYRGDGETALMAPGALLLGDAGRCYTCGHEHGEGDRCISFHYAPELFEQIAAESGARSRNFPVCRLPPARATAGLVVQAVGAAQAQADPEEAALALAAGALGVARETRLPRLSLRDISRAAEAVREMEAQADAAHSIASLARRARMSPFRLLRAFKAATGTSPHQFLLRLRLRNAARLLLDTGDAVTDIAYRVGFEDLSNFIRSFRAEFGGSPRAWRKERGVQTAGASRRL